MEFVTMALWLSGWIALAVLIPKPSACDYGSCHAVQASIVVAAVEWALFAFTNVYAFLDVANSRRTRRHHHDQHQHQHQQPAVSQVNPSGDV
ncbi:Uncharacterized protein PECH_003573 [Penicillium ucsense]|uniref:MARVEL domain-containing protein n=1 Tax=Penicillium ucsense TaxID=2839758 RepID=A0A8J8VW23_9EURO|nr:Uncharacterized protein PECM_002985 [Penicillium ucsense]KAF7729402.1 Uncharacterized protein PECH_003573 [Penicillium ucsense]